MELLVVIAIISILITITLTAINPTKQLGDARNAQRRMDVQTILNAVHQYSVDTNLLPSDIPLGSLEEICATGAPSCDGVDLDVLVSTYLVAIPRDPQAAETETDYMIMKGSEGRVTVTAPSAEQGAIITISR